MTLPSIFPSFSIRFCSTMSVSILRFDEMADSKALRSACDSFTGFRPHEAISRHIIKNQRIVTLLYRKSPIVFI